MATKRKFAPPIVQETTPALATYTDEVLFGDVWERAELPKRDRSLVTVAALIAGNHTTQMTGHFNRALDNGMTATEIAAVITHLAFYCGWPRAMSAVAVARAVFDARSAVTTEATGSAGEPVSADSMLEEIGAVSPALARYTQAVLFEDLWRRADLAPRDRSLVTIAALIAGGHVEQLPFHLRRGLENGLRGGELKEVVTHLAFYAGWPRSMSAVPVLKAVLG